MKNFYGFRLRRLYQKKSPSHDAKQSLPPDARVVISVGLTNQNLTNRKKSPSHDARRPPTGLEIFIAVLACALSSYVLMTPFVKLMGDREYAFMPPFVKLMGDREYAFMPPFVKLMGDREIDQHPIECQSNNTEECQSDNTNQSIFRK